MDQKSLANCRMVSTSWKKFLEKQKFYWIRMIKAYILFPKVYQRIFRLSSVENIRQYFLEVREFYKNDVSEVGQTPIHFAAQNGQLLICKTILSHVENKNPMDKEGHTPLYYAAKYGQMVVCQ